MEQDANANNTNVSALEHNIKSKGEFSYYYAHGRKFEKTEEESGKTVQGPGIITGGDPVLLEKSVKEVEIIKEPKKFTKYVFMDDDKFVSVRIELPEEIKELISQECIDLKLSDKSLDLRVNVPNGEPYFYSVKKLFKKIDPNECSSKIVKGKIVINLKKKEEDEEWDKLNA
jgi:HSP20 family molecular chaperone IbpA